MRCARSCWSARSRLLFRGALGLGDLRLDLGKVIGVELDAHLAECATAFLRGHRIRRRDRSRGRGRLREALPGPTRRAPRRARQRVRSRDLASMADGVAVVRGEDTAKRSEDHRDARCTGALRNATAHRSVPARATQSASDIVSGLGDNSIRPFFLNWLWFGTAVRRPVAPALHARRGPAHRTS